MKHIEKREDGSVRVYHTFEGEECITSQSARKETDLNYLMKRHKRLSEIPFVKKNPMYGDFSTVGDYTQALETIKRSKEAFGQLSAEVQKRFNHNPAELLQFVNDINNKEEAIKLGLIEKPAEQQTEEPESAPESE